MEEVYTDLTYRAQSLRKQHRNKNCAHPRLVIAMSGPPGSGKSTIAAEVVKRINKASNIDSTAIVLPMDGFHLTQENLRALPNSDEAFARRGVHWTYDADAVLALVSSLHHTRNNRESVHFAPSFDHALKDPMENAIEITADVGLIIIEGNWLLYDEFPWSSISRLVDETWFVDVEEGVAMERVVKRHIMCGIEKSQDQAYRRAKYNDMANGVLVRTKLVPPKLRVLSVDEIKQS